MFAELLFSAVAVIAPEDGATVSLMSEAQRGYLALPRAERFAKFDDAGFRRELAKDGGCPLAVDLEWRGDTNAVYLVSVDDWMFAVSNCCSVRVINLVPGRDYRWSVRAAGETETASAGFRTAADLPRLVYAEGVRNLRDLGGWRTLSGRKVRSGMIYRSAGLRSSARPAVKSIRNPRFHPGRDRVTGFGLAALEGDLGIRTDIELRSLTDAAFLKSSLVSGARWVHVPFLAYDSIADEVQGRAQFAKIFREFLRQDGYPVLFHCSSGRDRTGTLAFLLNGLLGVPEDDLCRDWECTAFGDDGSSLISGRIVKLINYLHTFAGADINGQIEQYVKSCGVTDGEIAAFRAIMLEGGAE